MTLAPIDSTTAFRLTTGSEILEVQSILQAQGLLGPEQRIAYLGLIDPPRQAALAGAEADRRFRVYIHDGGGVPRDVIVSLSRGEVESVLELDTGTTGEL